ncbi:MAG: hypothetical protein ACYCSW_05345 [bacterium]
MLGFIIFFIIFGSIFIFLGIALIRSVIIQKREHPYRYCEYPREKAHDISDPFNLYFGYGISHRSKDN